MWTKLVERSVAVHADAEVDLGMDASGYRLGARLNVSLPGLARDLGQQVIEMAHNTCPYSKALKGNIGIELKLI